MLRKAESFKTVIPTKMLELRLCAALILLMAGPRDYGCCAGWDFCQPGENARRWPHAINGLPASLLCARRLAKGGVHFAKCFLEATALITSDTERFAAGVGSKACGS